MCERATPQGTTPSRSVPDRLRTGLAAHSQAAVHHENGAGNVTGLVIQQEPDRVRHLLGAAVPGQRDHPEDHLLVPLGSKCSQDADTSVVDRRRTMAVEDKLPLTLIRRVLCSDAEDP